MPTECLADVGGNQDATGEACGGDGGTAGRFEATHDVAGPARPRGHRNMPCSCLYRHLSLLLLCFLLLLLLLIGYYYRYSTTTTTTITAVATTITNDPNGGGASTTVIYSFLY